MFTNMSSTADWGDSANRIVAYLYGTGFGGKALVPPGDVDLFPPFYLWPSAALSTAQTARCMIAVWMHTTAKRRLSAGPASPTLGQHWGDVGLANHFVMTYVVFHFMCLSDKGGITWRETLHSLQVVPYLWTTR